MSKLGTACLALFFSHALLAAEPPRLMRHPTASATSVVFEFAGDLWTVPRAGGAAERLTRGPAREYEPSFSPDGKWIAFTGEYEANDDVYVVAAEGGVPRRLTWHPGSDHVVGWSPDGKRILFRSSRLSSNSYMRLFSIAPGEGMPVPVDLPAGYAGSYSPDGRRLAYVPNPQFQPAWKRYRGGQTTPIWIADLTDGSIVKVPRDNSNDSWPMWVGGAVWFVSDRDGPATLYAYDVASGTVARKVEAAPLDVKSATYGPGGIAWERPGEIHLLDPATGRDALVPVTISADLLEVRPRWETVGDAVQNAEVSPNGVRAVFEARGDVFTVPAEKGDVRNLTRTPGVAERDPAWSPDGKSIAFFSDESGDYALHVVPQDGRGEAKVIPLGDPPSYFYSPRFSPDSKKVLYHDKRLTLWYVDVAGGAPVKVDADAYETPERSLDPSWSPDSGWIVYTKTLPSFFHAVFAYELSTKKIVQLSDGMSDARYPVFDADGKHLYFAASTNLGLGASWLDMSGFERPLTRSVYVVVLRKDGPSPLAPESDEEKPEEKADEKPKADDKKGKDKEKDKPAVEPVVIDADRIGQRTLALPIPAANFVGLQAGKAGTLFLLEGPTVFTVAQQGPPSFTLRKFTMKERKAEEFLGGVQGFTVAAKGEKLLYRTQGGWFLASTDKAKPGEGGLKLDGMKMLVDPLAEWRQMFHEAWRIQRDFLYDPGLHGLSLAKVTARYEPFLAGLGSRDDLDYLFEEMLGETTVGHTFVNGGDVVQPPPVQGGLLGADLAIESGRYRFTRVFDGESWNPDLRAPLTQPGVDVKVGEYLLAVDGRELRPPENPFAPFANTAGKQVVLRVGSDPEGKSARDVTVVPVSSEGGLRSLAWVEDNRRTVDRLSGGKLAYVYLPNTGGAGYTYFNRWYFAQIGREGAVIDERFNGGGSLADYIVDAMSRPARSRIAFREGKDETSPAAAIYGPKVMLINEMAGSGGDALPWYFRKAGLGKLVGKRTWGGLVGIYGYPQLIDGGSVTAPRAALYDLDGTWKVENVGIAPDVEVDYEPKAWREGRDAQLEKAVAIAMEELKKHPPASYPRPEYPDYHSGDGLGN